MLIFAPTLSDYRKAVEGYIVFATEPTVAERERIEASIPVPLSLNMRWTKNILQVASDDLFSRRVRLEYGTIARRFSARYKGLGTRAAESELTVFFKMFHAKLVDIHRTTPILFCVLPVSDDEDLVVTELFPEGDRYSYIRELTDVVLPFLSTQLTIATTEEKTIIAWIIRELFDYIPRSTISIKTKADLASLISQSLGTDEYIDKTNSYLLTQL